MKKILLLLLCAPWAYAQINPSEIIIIRDSFGVPHIKAPTDAGAAYGLAWANAEDDFATMQELLIAGQGRSGQLLGKEGAKRDFLLHTFAVKDIVNAKLFELLRDAPIEYHSTTRLLLIE